MCFRADIHSRKDAAEQAASSRKASPRERVEAVTKERPVQEFGVMATLRRLFASLHASLHVRQQSPRQDGEPMNKTTDDRRELERVD